MTRRMLPTFAGRKWRPLDSSRRATVPPKAASILLGADIFETDSLDDPERVIVGIWPHFAPKDSSPHYLMNMPRTPTGLADVAVAVREDPDGIQPTYADAMSGERFTVGMAQ